MVRVEEKIKQEIVALYPTHTQKELARKFKLSPWQIMSIMSEAGAKKNSPLTDERRAEIVSAYRSGDSISAIANRFHVHKSYITRVAREGGAALRKPRRSSTFYLAYLDSGLNPYWGA
jgi:DNA invertase Pin-like site-specific DNA recombinase